MSAELAAREGDAIGAHAGAGSGGRFMSNALTWAAIGAGAVGLVVGAVLAAPVVLGVGTVAGAAALLGGGAGITLGVIGGALSGAAGGIGLQREAEKAAPAKLGGGCSSINVGSPNVSIEGKKCARAQTDTNVHGPPKKLSEGSGTVIVNGKPLSRLHDKSCCGGKVISSASRTFIGGPAATGGPGASPIAAGGSFTWSDMDTWNWDGIETGLNVAGLLIGAGAVSVGFRGVVQGAGGVGKMLTTSAGRAAAGNFSGTIATGVGVSVGMSAGGGVVGGVVAGPGGAVAGALAGEAVANAVNPWSRVKSAGVGVAKMIKSKPATPKPAPRADAPLPARAEPPAQAAAKTPNAANATASANATPKPAPAPPPCSSCAGGARGKSPRFAELDAKLKSTEPMTPSELKEWRELHFKEVLEPKKVLTPKEAAEWRQMKARQVEAQRADQAASWARLRKEGKVGDLRDHELAAIQKRVDDLGEDVYVLGSAAKGKRRNLDTDLPLATDMSGDKSKTRSDIDYAVATEHGDRAQKLDFPDADGKLGVLEIDAVNLKNSPAIRFRPGESPEYFPKGESGIPLNEAGGKWLEKKGIEPLGGPPRAKPTVDEPSAPTRTPAQETQAQQAAAQQDRQWGLRQNGEGPTQPQLQQQQQANAGGGNPPLNRLHSDATTTNSASYDHWRSRPNDEIVKSLKPGGEEPLRVDSSGKVWDGNTRVQVLEERGHDVNALPRERYQPSELDPLGEPRGAGANAAGPAMDPHTASVLAEHGMTRDSVVYRVMDEKHLDPNAMTVEGNPNSIARILDPSSPVPNPRRAMIDQALKDGEITPAQHAKMTADHPETSPKEVTAKRVGPGLNVAGMDPGVTYGVKPGQRVVAIKVSDIVARGGRIYRDVSSNGGGQLKALYATFDGPVPFRFADPTCASCTGAPVAAKQIAGAAQKALSSVPSPTPAAAVAAKAATAKAALNDSIKTFVAARGAGNRTLSQGELMDLVSHLGANEQPLLNDLTANFTDKNAYPERPAVFLGDPKSGPSIWLLGWREGDYTPIHDHGNSRAAVHVWKGPLEETVYNPNTLDLATQRSVPEGKTVPIPAPYIHVMGNSGAVTPEAISIHAYDPPLQMMDYYENVDGKAKFTGRWEDDEILLARAQAEREAGGPK